MIFYLLPAEERGTHSMAAPRHHTLLVSGLSTIRSYNVHSLGALIRTAYPCSC